MRVADVESNYSGCNCKAVTKDEEKTYNCVAGTIRHEKGHEYATYNMKHKISFYFH